MTTRTPLRYPGGKSRITPFIQMVMDENKLTGGEYVEPYAGGAGVAINLLYSGHANHVHINDINPAVFAFWTAVFDHTDALCELICKTPVTMETWHLQKSALANPVGLSHLELGFAAFFLNRTNRSGILTGGVIGGKDQTGKWKIDARYNVESLCLKIESISTYRESVSIYNLDAESLLVQLTDRLPAKSLIYLDPPYYVKSKRLYQDLYTHDDHVSLAQRVQGIKKPWLVSYDDVPEIRDIYSSLRVLRYPLNYSAAKKYLGAEALFVSPKLKLRENFLPV